MSKEENEFIENLKGEHDRQIKNWKGFLAIVITLVFLLVGGGSRVVLNLTERTKALEYNVEKIHVKDSLQDAAIDAILKHAVTSDQLNLMMKSNDLHFKIMLAKISDNAQKYHQLVEELFEVNKEIQDGYKTRFPFESKIHSLPRYN